MGMDTETMDECSLEFKLHLLFLHCYNGKDRWMISVDDRQQRFVSKSCFCLSGNFCNLLDLSGDIP
jgi:hypothetical protein